VAAHWEIAMKRSVIAAVAALAAAAASAAETARVPYPEGFRSWTHVKSMIIEPGHSLYESFGGIHHIYANDEALQGYAKGVFPDGAVIVFDLFEAKPADNAVTEGSRKLIGVMVKDRARHAATGGWAFEGFKGDSRTERLVKENAPTACFGCHQARAGDDFVFSATRD
jgi:hypothetical protein